MLVELMIWVFGAYGYKVGAYGSKVGCLCY